MELYIGGYAQGKLTYVLETHTTDALIVTEDTVQDVPVHEDKRIVLNHFHLWVKKHLLEGKCPEDDIRSFVEEHPDCIIISDEIGNGIVPMSHAEREYRERLGRIQIELAKRAERVERVICQMGQRLK